MKKLKKYGSAVGIILLTLFLSWIAPPVVQKIRHLCPVRSNGVNEAQAVSQFARKYSMSCNACHTAFPRLTAFGERFKANGFQMLDSQDGDETGKNRVTDRLFISEIGNLIGLRIALNPIQVKTKSLDRDSNGTKESTLVNVGTADWLQLFTAGSIFKNVSIFIETEIAGNANNTVKNNWFMLGWHNIVGENGAMSARLGNIPQADWHVMSGRLRMIPNINVQAMSGRSNSESAPTGKSNDQIALSDAVPGIEIFGLPKLWNAFEFVYSGVLSQGKKQADDKNELQNYSSTLGIRKNGGDFDGSQISVFGNYSGDTSTTSYVSNRWFTVSPGVNLRYKGLDLIAAYYYSEDSNGNLNNTSAPMKLKSNGIAGQIGYTINPAWWTGVQYDWVDSGDRPAENFNKISPTIWFFPRENIRIGLVGRLDMDGTTVNTTHPSQIHEILAHIRAMF
ncbi:MAG: hypothetical protein A3I11_07190 [Elusimicrobia bacterium RIFCSPLOWO2_02_FULL_39_32]|nr:MAG: hypothetical protein A2034_01445 [Elusimicrobia bacterium GWA2_38_7]OGR81460.1 MAG: hypothetical protein A3B80_05435 [Elusimicrobia bacterium RIFCSPHIGHO2_02_FULL_39_36]OGR91971.1 MAG: hypothetical protein A3I11_07190 [Elusimicrobia bacterium RIFCSPLOWO2_02_FULL_39_32]OGR98737.1 MAG: hypothetical protein A3G85_05240 [Elusimicrobia bacterium RIFCSPLOWO2_12_FULL_39_28]